MDFTRLAPAWMERPPTRGICPRCGQLNALKELSFPADEPTLSYECRCGAEWDEHYTRSGGAVVDGDTLVLVQDLPTMEHEN